LISVTCPVNTRPWCHRVWKAMAPPKRKNLHADEDNLNDGSDSDDSADGYLPRQRVERVHFVLDESITIAATGQTRSTKSTVPTPASPAKKSRVTLNTDARPPSPSPPPEDLRTDWQADFSEFDAEYGPGLEKPSRDLRASVGGLNVVVSGMSLTGLQDNPHAQFAQEDREEFLDELVRQDGRGDYVYQRLCAAAGCAASSPAYRCSDCLHPCLYCERCVKLMHESLPLHHLEVSSSYVASTAHPDLNNCRSGMGRRSTAAASRIWGCGSSSGIPQGSHAQTPRRPGGTTL
jgi:hypothetical protein